MRFEDYAAARRTCLVERAIDLGVDADDAPDLVDRVLERHRRQVERAADPDPRLYDAVARAVAPARPVPRRPLLVVGALVLLAVVSGAGVLAWPEPEAPARVIVPTLFGLDATAAGRVLREAGLDVALTTVPVCEPPGLVLGSAPAGGRRAEEGSTVEVRSAISPDDECPGLTDRADAWAFVAFARGGPAPDFAETVRLVVDGSEPFPLSGATDPTGWGGLLDAIAAVYAAPALSGTSTPHLVVRSATPPARECGGTRPPAAGDRVALRLQVQPDPEHRLACPLTVDLYRDTAGIDVVVVRTADYDAVSKWS